MKFTIVKKIPVWKIRPSGRNTEINTGVDYLLTQALRHQTQYLSKLGLWIVRQVAILSDPRFMSYDSQIELQVTG